MKVNLVQQQAGEVVEAQQMEKSLLTQSSKVHSSL